MKTKVKLISPLGLACEYFSTRETRPVPMALLRLMRLAVVRPMLRSIPYSRMAHNGSKDTISSSDRIQQLNAIDSVSRL